MIKNDLPLPIKIEFADIYRDGGSYGIGFIDENKICCELLLKVRLDPNSFRRIGYKEPILEIYDSENFENIKDTKQLTWNEGILLFEELSLLFNRNHFHHKSRAKEMYELINLKGNIPENALK